VKKKTCHPRQGEVAEDAKNFYPSSCALRSLCVLCVNKRIISLAKAGKSDWKYNESIMSYRENLSLGASPEIHRRAQELRKRMTPCENILWERLKGKHFLGYKFRRQHPLYKYIVDFYCHQLKLVIEVDGSVHLGADAVEYDFNT